MRRPLSEYRPIGPFADKFTELYGNGKDVIGISGTPFPDQQKEELLVIYVLSGEGERVVSTRDFSEAIQMKINGRPEFEGFVVDFLKSGKSSKKDFTEQAVLVRVPPEQIAITESDLQIIEGIIKREIDGIQIKERIYEMQGKP